MKTGFMRWVVLGGLVCGCGWAEGAGDPVARARGAAGALGASLKERLMAAMQQGGPAAGIVVCADEAEGLAEAVSTRLGVEVRRTSDRARNPANRPGDWQARGLADLAERHAAGTAAADLVWVESDEQEVRVMLPIVTEPLCLTCHGAELAPDVVAALARRYPEDTATGYAAGELRGAFSVRWPVHPEP